MYSKVSSDPIRVRTAGAHKVNSATADSCGAANPDVQSPVVKAGPSPRLRCTLGPVKMIFGGVAAVAVGLTGGLASAEAAHVGVQMPEPAPFFPGVVDLGTAPESAPPPLPRASTREVATLLFTGPKGQRVKVLVGERHDKNRVNIGLTKDISEAGLLTGGKVSYYREMHFTREEAVQIDEVFGNHKTRGKAVRLLTSLMGATGVRESDMQGFREVMGNRQLTLKQLDFYHRDRADAKHFMSDESEVDEAGVGFAHALFTYEGDYTVRIPWFENATIDMKSGFKVVRDEIEGLSDDQLKANFNMFATAQEVAAAVFASSTSALHSVGNLNGFGLRASLARAKFIDHYVGKLGMVVAEVPSEYGNVTFVVNRTRLDDLLNYSGKHTGMAVYADRDQPLVSLPRPHQEL